MSGVERLLWIGHGEAGGFGLVDLTGVELPLWIGDGEPGASEAGAGGGGGADDEACLF